jgi:ribose-phosphate pyrophosphokinase
MKRFNFPGGEVHIKYEQESYLKEPRYNLWSSDDIMAMLLKEDIRNSTFITIPYMPYARQDRKTSKEEPFSLKVMAGIINNLGARNITIWDPHSDVTPALINGCRVISQEQILEIGIKNFKISKFYDGIIAPDAGASKKALKVAQLFGCPMYQAGKVRDTKTGEILKTVMYDDLEDGARYLVVDDICDGGRTFLELAIAITRNADCYLDLYVTHGIFSKGLEELSKFYNKFYTANLHPSVALALNLHCFFNNETIL